MQTAIKFEQLVQFRIPSVLSDAIEEGREARCQSKSDFIRQVVVDRLRSSRTCSRVSAVVASHRQLRIAARCPKSEVNRKSCSRRVRYDDPLTAIIHGEGAAGAARSTN